MNSSFLKKPVGSKLENPSGLPFRYLMLSFKKLSHWLCPLARFTLRLSSLNLCFLLSDVQATNSWVRARVARLDTWPGAGCCHCC